MRKLIFKMSLLAIGCFFMLVGTSFALPLVNQDAEVTRVPGVTLGGDSGGGEFLIKIYDDATVGIGDGSWTGDEYISFCLEFNEHISLSTRYNIAGVDDFTENGGQQPYGTDTEDPVSEKTKWLFWNYLYSIDSSVARDDDTMANDVQRVIWFYENEAGSAYNESALDNSSAASAFFSSSTALTLYEYVEAQANYSDIGIVKVLNLVDANGDPKQSQLIAEPVPEPATMLLFGTGLIGLAGIARRRKNKK